MELPRIDRARIAGGASTESYSRGVRYYHQGAVEDLVLRGDLLHAAVAGSEDEPYRVSVTFDKNGVRGATCTCPYDWGGWCKHIVAALLAYADDPDNVQVRPSLAELLAPLDRERLVALLVSLAERDSTLADRVDALLVPVAARTSVAVSAAPRPTVVDPAALQRQLRQIFKGADYDDYEAGSAIVAGLEPIVARIRALLDAGDSEAALALLDGLTAEFSVQWTSYDDSDGELGGLLDSLGPLWAEALLDADLTRAERRSLRDRLDGWSAGASEYGVDGLIVALRAAEEGWDAPWLAAAMRDDPQPVERPCDWTAELLLPIRLTVLARKGLFRDALNLAVATGRHREEAVLRARLDRPDEAVAVARASFRMADEALALAQVFRETGDQQRALVVGELGLSLAPPRAELAGWLLELAAAQGQRALALSAGGTLLREAPSLTTYQALGEIAGKAWPAARETLLEQLRAVSLGWQTARGLVDIYLHEGLLDDAIRVVSSAAGAGELQRVMEAALPARAEWVVATATARAGAIVDAGQAAYYDAAIEWLRLARAGYRALGQDAAWDAYVGALRAAHRRKTKLMGLLDRLELTRRH